MSLLQTNCTTLSHKINTICLSMLLTNHQSCSSRALDSQRKQRNKDRKEGGILYKKDTGGEGRRAEMKTGGFYASEKCDVWCVPEWVLAAMYVKNVTFIHF